MIIVKLQGGLGNQMFQWAFGKTLSEKFKLPLKIDLSFLKRRDLGNNFTYRNYELDLFNIDNDFIINPTKKIFNILESGFHHENKYVEFIKNNDGHFYIDGYWQSPLYFNEYNDLICSYFSFKDKIDNSSGITKELLSKIRETNSVLINVRRGDFVNSSFHGCVDSNYINNSIKEIKKYVSSPIFFVFSDDIEWCKNNLNSENFIFVDHQHSGDRYSYYFQLMKECKHQIISNSTFAWWAAYLNNNIDKKVIYPGNWFLDKSVKTDDLFPKSWIKIYN